MEPQIVQPCLTPYPSPCYSKRMVILTGFGWEHEVRQPDCFSLTQHLQGSLTDRDGLGRLIFGHDSPEGNEAPVKVNVGPFKSEYLSPSSTCQKTTSDTRTARTLDSVSRTFSNRLHSSGLRCLVCSLSTLGTSTCCRGFGPV